MKLYLYTTSFTGTLTTKIYRKVIFLFFMLCLALITVGQSGPGGGSGNENSGPGNNNRDNKELVFSNAVLETGNDGANGAIYRFPSVGTGIDALVKIVSRSDSRVRLVSIDLTNTGWQKAFQPQVTFNNGNANAGNDWWMEFDISFVQKD